MKLPRIESPIRLFAVLTVAITSAFVMWMSYRLVEILAAPEWCARAINAEKLANSRTATSLDLCKDLLLKQVGSLAVNSHIYAGVIALCLLTLIVIVIAGGKLSFAASKTGVSANMGKEVDQAVDTVVEATEQAGADVKAGIAPAEALPDYAK